MITGRPYDPNLMSELLKTANRGYSTGFLKGTFTDDDIHYEKNEPKQTHKFIGVVRDHKGLVEVRNRIEKGDKVEIFTPTESFEAKIEDIFDEEGENLEAAHGGAGERTFKFNKNVPINSIIRMKL